MQHDHAKKCLDDSIMVDTSSGATRGQHAFAAWLGIMNDWQRRLLAGISWPLPS